MLSNEDISRYKRHLLLEEVGVKGQEKLKAAKVAIVGIGGLGSPAALYLAAAGIGTLGLIDDDLIDVSNLQRQVLFTEETVGCSKVRTAATRIREINSASNVVETEERMTEANAHRLLAGYDVVIDATDNFATRYVINDACVMLGVPDVYGSVYRFEGQASVFATKDGPCYRCIYPEAPDPELIPTCEEDGVLGVLPGMIGLVQATETLKLLLGLGDGLSGRMLLYDLLAMQFREVRLRKNPECPVCGDQRQNQTFATRSVNEKLDVTPEHSISVESYAEQRTKFEHLLLDVREPFEVELASIGGLNIPMSAIPLRLDQLPRERHIVIYCHHGTRSRRAQQWLLERGYGKVTNLTGGIDAWSLRVDRGVRRY